VKNYWYVSQENEIFIDMDNFKRSINHARVRLVGAIECNRLSVLRVESHESSPNKIHSIVTLNEPMRGIERATWGIILHSDLYRAASTIMRYLYNVNAADVLITPKKFNREPDDFCECERKHIAEVMDKCPAAIRLRGEKRTAGFFGKPNNKTDWEWPIDTE
jgi:hypothetical protein